jgi:hypothetical protein
MSGSGTSRRFAALQYFGSYWGISGHRAGVAKLKRLTQTGL